MSREIDERLVAMKFDNTQFENGVKESLASLAALREGLELDGAADSFEDVFKASEKYLDFKEPTKAVGGLQTALSKVGSVARSAFSTFTAPIKAVSSMVQGLYGDVSRLFGLDIAYKMEQSAIKTFQAFTTEPLSTGFQEYETKVDSLKAIMNSTAEAYTEKMRKQAEDEYKMRETAFKQQLKGQKLSSKEKKDALEKFKLENDAEYAAKKHMEEQLKASQKEYEERKKALELEAKQNKLSKEERDKRLKSLLAEKEERDGIYTKEYKEVKDNRYTYDEDAHRKIVEDKIEELNKYADKTIYSFSDMMQALPTLTNMGVEIDTAVSVVKGLHNLAAIAGKGAQEAKRALYNLGDAFSMGHFESKDWKTMEYAGLATPQFKKIAIEMAARNGSLIEKNGKYFAKKVSEKGVEKLYEVTTETFKDTLQYDWFDKTAMENAFKVLSGDLTELDLLKMGFDKKADADTINYFLDLGKQAMEAAQQVRTFTKMMDALKEAAQSGWSKTYELLFGVDKDAIAFWTPINDAISGILERSADARNSVLEAWSKSTVFVDGKFVSTRNAIRDSIIRIVEMFDLFKNSVRIAWEYAFGKIDSKKLVNLTKRIGDLTTQWKNWFGDKTDENSNITKITNALKGFFSVINPIIGSIKDVFSWIASKVSPVLGTMFEKITKFGDDLRLKFRGTKNLKDVFEIIRNSSTGNVRKALDWLSELPEKISSKWQEIQNWYNGSSLKGIVDNVWGRITGFFDAPDDEDETKGGFDRMIGWIIEAKDVIAEKWDEVKAWWNDPENSLRKITGTIWEGIVGFFDPPEGSFLSNISGFFTNLWDTIISLLYPEESKEAVKTLRESGALITAAASATDANFGGSKKQTIFDRFLDYIAGLKQRFNELNIGDFFTNIWDSISSFFQPRTIIGKQGNTWTVSPFEDFKNGLIEQWDSFTTTLEPTFKDIGSFFSNTWHWITSQFTETETVTNEDGTEEVHSKIGAKFATIHKTILQIWDIVKGWSIWADIGEFLKDPWAWIKKIAGVVSDSFGTAVESVKEFASDSEIFAVVRDFFTSIFGGIADLIREADGSEMGRNVVTSISKIFETLGRLFEVVFGILDRVFQNIDATVREVRLTMIITAILNFSKFLANLKQTLQLSIGYDSLATKMLKMAGAIILVSLAVGYLGAMKTDQLMKGAVAVIVLAGSIAAICKAFALMEKETLKEVAENKINTFGDKVVKVLTTIGTTLLSVWLVIENLPSILSTISEHDFRPGAFIEVITGIIELAFGITLLTAMISKFNLGANPGGTLMGVLTGMGAIAISMLSFLALLTIIGGLIGTNIEAYEGNKDNFISFIGIIGEIAGAIIGMYHGTKIKKELEGIGEGVKEGTEALSEIPIEELDKFLKSISTLADIATSLPDINLIAQVFGSDKFSLFADNIGLLGQQLAIFSSNVKDITNLDDAVRAVEIINSIADAARTLAIADAIAEGSSNGLKSATDVLSNYMNVLAIGTDGIRDLDLTETFGAVGSLAAAINKGIEDTAVGIVATPIVAAIATGILADSDKLTPAIKQAIADAYDSLSTVEKVVSDDGSDFISNLLGAADNAKSNMPDVSSLLDLTGLQNEINGFANGLDYTQLETNLGSVFTNISGTLTSGLQSVENNIANLDFGASDVQPVSDLFDYGTSIGESMLAGFREKASELASIISESIDTAPVITPVLDLTQFNADLLRLNQAVPGRFMYNLGGGALVSPATADWTLINEITKANEAAQENMAAIMANGLSSIVTAISGVSVEMDGYSVGKVVTPYVDANISATLVRYLRNLSRPK